jgi:hypothetical protein
VICHLFAAIPRSKRLVIVPDFGGTPRGLCGERITQLLKIPYENNANHCDVDGWPGVDRPHAIVGILGMQTDPNRIHTANEASKLPVGTHLIFRCARCKGSQSMVPE